MVELKAFIYHNNFPLIGVLFNSLPKWEEYPCKTKKNFFWKNMLHVRVKK